jgi:hypothetical protein
LESIRVDKAEFNRSLAETLRVLKDIDPVLEREARKTLKGAAQLVARYAQGEVPAGPPTGISSTGRYNWGAWGGSRDWVPSNVKRGIKVRIRTRGSGRRDQRQIVAIVQGSAAGAVFDMAGRAGNYKGRQGEAFVRALNKHGRASRTMWPAYEAKAADVDAAMIDAVNNMSNEINARLGRGGAAIFAGTSY